MRKQLFRDKKGMGLEDLKGIVFILIVLGLLFGVGLYLLTELRYRVDVTEAYTNTNESLLIDVNETGVPIANSSYRDCHITSAVCTNESFNDAIEGVIPSENYTTTGCTITAAFTVGADIAGFNNTVWNCTTEVSYNIDKEASSSIMNVTEATNDLATWLPIIVVILAASLVIGIVIRKFGGGVS